MTDKRALRKAAQTWTTADVRDMATAIIAFHVVAPDGGLNDEIAIYMDRYTELAGEAAAEALAHRIVGGLVAYDGAGRPPQ